jgi:hypothetical protein
MDEDTFWNDSIDALRLWRKKHPNYAPQIYKVQKTFEDMRIQHQKNMQQYFQKKSVGYFEQAEKIKHDAELIYKKISKLELLATLSK